MARLLGQEESSSVVCLPKNSSKEVQQPHSQKGQGASGKSLAWTSLNFLKRLMHEKRKGINSVIDRRRLKKNACFCIRTIFQSLCLACIMPAIDWYPHVSSVRGKDTKNMVMQRSDQLTDIPILICMQVGIYSQNQPASNTKLLIMPRKEKSEQKRNSANYPICSYALVSGLGRLVYWLDSFRSSQLELYSFFGFWPHNVGWIWM